jgi:hypothetical protein
MNTMNLITRLKQYPRQGIAKATPQQSLNPQSLPQNTSALSAVGTVASVRDNGTAAAVNDQITLLAQQLANQMIADQQQAQLAAKNGRTYTKFDMANDVIANQTEVVTGGLWSDNVASLTTYFSSSAETITQRRYYIDTYQADPATDTAAVQYSLAYGNALGSGSDSQGQLNDSPSKAIYSQYKQLLLAPGDTRFTTAGSGSTDSIYVVNFKRNRLRERLDPGNFELPLTKVTSRDSNATGSVVVGTTVVTLIDDSVASTGSIGQSGRVYNIVSGSINGGIYTTGGNKVYYGLVYPDYGTLILDGKMLDNKLTFLTNTGSSSEGNNHFALFHSISGSALFTDPATSDPYGFLARNSEKVTSTHYFVRIKNAEYNFSNNPSYITGSVGQLAQTTFVGDPKTYITTVGLYNDRQELLAVAKLSKPLLKSFQREALIRVKLDF